MRSALLAASLAALAAAKEVSWTLFLVNGSPRPPTEASYSGGSADESERDCGAPAPGTAAKATPAGDGQRASKGGAI